MKRSSTQPNAIRISSQLPPLAIATGVFLVYWYSNPAPMEYIDYTLSTR